ncbi:thiamine phosphate synthase [Furfurilactobacillus siliginis]|uniref:Thiamine-phosphate synthase n=1 Tax=Furfurilactobacillus siliginis TaxID=348151 RepID=A0A0R2LEI5_9LACO|nr:thiamine phosphate synthase [Furfurilactobacillus siliginis]KRN96989.1 thiamine-phosphate diphosphorylase [Furfurilactobacillus siliginis]GEK27748.1 thiamine-phosphate synthase [Furfurilactobacillus siliginis]
MKFNPQQLAVYFVAGTKDVPTGETLPTILAKAITAGITAFQYREKGPLALTGAKRELLGKQLRQQCLAANIPFFVDDDLALALALDADGIHVGQSDQAIETVVSLAPDLIIGYSCHTPAQIDHANQLAAIDYVGSGPIYPTVSKADADPAIGVTGLASLVSSSRVPVVAIGGISVQNVADVAMSGCAGTAVISAIAQASNINDVVNKLNAPFK